MLCVILFSVTIPIEEILSVSKITGRKGDGFEVIGFTIGCVRHLKKNKMKREMVQFLCTSEEGELWTEKIQKALSQCEFMYLCMVQIIKLFSE